MPLTSPIHFFKEASCVSQGVSFLVILWIDKREHMFYNVITLQYISRTDCILSQFGIKWKKMCWRIIYEKDNICI